MFENLIRRQYSYVAVGVGVASAAGSIIAGASAKAKQKRELEKLKNPFYKIQDEFYQNRNIAAQQAQQGLPQSTMDYYTSESNRAFGSGIDALLKGGADSTAVTSLFDTYNKGIRDIGSESAMQQQKNIDRFMETNRELAGQKINQWTLNTKQPYEQKLAQINQNMAAADQNINQGIQTGLSAVGGLGKGLQYQKLLKAQTKGYGAMADYYNHLFGTMNRVAPVSGSVEAINQTAGQYPQVNTVLNANNPTFGTVQDQSEFYNE